MLGVWRCIAIKSMPQRQRLCCQGRHIRGATLQKGSHMRRQDSVAYRVLAMGSALCSIMLDDCCSTSC